MEEHRPKIVDLFSGAGGFSLGFLRAGFSVELAVDNYEEAVQIYNENIPGHHAVQSDLSQCSLLELCGENSVTTDKIDIVIGGPPCQGFSVMGKRDPNDDRNDLLLRFAEYVNDVSPRYFIMENVKGLISGDAEDYLDLCLDIWRQGGYEVLQPIRVLDAWSHGVPQKRERVFVLGYKKGSVPPAYPAGLSYRPTVADAIGDLPSDLQNADIQDGVCVGSFDKPSDYVKKINSWKPKEVEPARSISGMDPVNHTRSVRDRFSNVEQGGNDNVSGYHRLDPNKPANTLRAGSSRDRGTHTPARPIHPSEPRVITVRESARLQSFPDWFKFHSTKYHSLRQIGNSVPPLVAHEIAEEFMSALEETTVIAK